MDIEKDRATVSATKSLSPNLNAFLDMIAWAEGTIGIGDDGYNVLFGSTKELPKLFTSYSDHPRIKTYETHDNFIANGKLDFTTAAGRYQIIKGMYDVCKKRLGLKDFSPESQDAIALYLIGEKCNLSVIDSGNIIRAIQFVAPIWASLPKSNLANVYHRVGEVQPKRSLEKCVEKYVLFGGALRAN